MVLLGGAAGPSRGRPSRWRSRHLLPNLVGAGAARAGALQARALALYYDCYAQESGRRTVVYPGVLDGLAQFRAMRLRLACALLSDCDLPRAAAIIRHWLHMIPVRSKRRNTSPLAILGLLEARLMRADVTVLAGLNEGVWPGPADCGPWINRPMRELLDMKQPESQIGQTAHDFVQAFGNPCVKLIWSRRIGDSPATLSRWILRLQMILDAAGL
jgi:hypothetical protein